MKVTHGRPLMIILIGLLGVAGCRGTRGGQEPIAVPSPTAVQVESPSAEVRVPDRGLAADLVAAVQAANDLERQLWETPEAFTSREQVYAHFRRGYAHDIAERLTFYAWSDEVDGLRPGDRSMAVPETVQVLRLDGAKAEVVYRNPPFLQELWGLKPYMRATLNKEKDGRWIILDARSTDKPLER